jgi:hypothetical protein
VYTYGFATHPNYSLEIDAPDDYEPNDSFETAYNLRTRGYFYDNLTIHESANDDWFRFTAGGSGQADISAYFSHAAGDLDLYVYHASHALIGSSVSTDDDESVSISVVQGETYYVLVAGYLGATNHYSLEIDAPLPPLDMYEPNDSFAAA